ncbi:MAG: hypothetical protein NT062_15775 [Proteobacteria bacterium]|nr:hypothetical protein [Pseudomonadota bacterium]
MRNLGLVLLLVACGGNNKQDGGAGSAAPRPPAGDPADCAAPVTCKPACDRGDLKACAFLGGYYATVSDDPTSTKKAQAALAKACSGGELAACAPLAEFHLENDYPRPRDAEGKALAAKACAAGFGDGCEDAAVAVPAWAKQCVAGDALACFDAAQAYATPGPDEPPDSTAIRAATPDDARAKDLTNKGRALLADACAKGRARGCLPGERVALAIAGIELSQQTRGCEHGNVISCTFAATKTSKTPATFLDFLDKTCALGGAPGCNDLVTLYASGGHGVDKDMAKAKAIARRACAADIGAFCSIETQLGK